MLTYSQSTGTFTAADGTTLVSGCYAGRIVASKLDGKNNPAAQSYHDLGPLPQGSYTIGPLHTVPHLGPCMALTPDPANTMFGRSGFFIHLDNPAHVGASSDGCIVLPSYADLVRIATLIEADNQVRVAG